MKYRSVLIEDEALSRSRLRRLLADFTEDIEIVGEAENGLEAVELINSIRPDLLFLDINLPGLDGFQLLGNLQSRPAVIFTTASDKHALEAFKTHAVDYLLKPIDPDHLRRAVEKLRTMGFNAGNFSRALERLTESLGVQYLNRLTCRVGDRLIIVKTADILYFHADNKYTSIYTHDRQFLTDASLVEMEKRLNPKEFIRIHRSLIVNVSWISEIRKGSDGKPKVIIRDKAGTALVASRNYADNLRKIES